MPPGRDGRLGQGVDEKPRVMLRRIDAVGCNDPARKTSEGGRHRELAATRRAADVGCLLSRWFRLRIAVASPRRRALGFRTGRFMRPRNWSSEAVSGVSSEVARK